MIEKALLFLNIFREDREIVNSQTWARDSRKHFASWETCDGRFADRLWRSCPSPVFQTGLGFLARAELRPGLNPSPCNRQFDFKRICFRGRDEISARLAGLKKIRHVIRPLNSPNSTAKSAIVYISLDSSPEREKLKDSFSPSAQPNKALKTFITKVQIIIMHAKNYRIQKFRLDNGFVATLKPAAEPRHFTERP